MRHLIFSIALLTLLGCGHQYSEDAPADLLSTSQVAEVQLHLELLQAVLKRDKLGVAKDSMVYLFERERDRIFGELGTDSAAFYSSYNYYIARPEVFLEIYTEINDSLGARRDAFRKEVPERDRSRSPEQYNDAD